MYIPSAYELLAVWERGLSLGSVQRGLLFLAMIFPELSDSALAQFSIGERDSRLLTLREQLFGSTVAGIANCPRCNEPLEFNFDLAAIRVPVTSRPAQHSEIDVQVGNYAIRCRVPNHGDLLAITLLTDASVARRALLQRCILTIDTVATVDSVQTIDSAPIIDQLPEAVTAVVVERMAHADPQSDVQIALICPACRHEWLAHFDILSFLWDEIAEWAQRSLREVHTLASAYGWHEVEILTMSAWRRQIYLQMISE